jgi:hypothetical protein
MRKIYSLSVLISSTLLTCGSLNSVCAQDKNPVVQGGSCASPDGSFFGTSLISSGSIDYNTANTNGLCYNNLNPGQTYCWTYFYPSSGNFRIEIILNETCGCDATLFNSLSPACSGTTCVSNPPPPFSIGCGAIQYNSSCAIQQNGGLEFGGSGACTPALTCGSIYTFCITVPAGCATMDVCPMVYCTAGTGNCALPVELLSFTGKNRCETNILYWTSASEINNDYYTIVYH